MRYLHNKRTRPQRGDKRLRWGFLWLPKRLDDETRWLEYAKWIQYYDTYSEWHCWRDLKWKDEGEDF